MIQYFVCILCNTVIQNETVTLHVELTFIFKATSDFIVLCMTIDRYRGLKHISEVSHVVVVAPHAVVVNIIVYGLFKSTFFPNLMSYH
jgi:hypothetical protein